MAGLVDSVVLTRGDTSVNVSVEDLNVSICWLEPSAQESKWCLFL